MHRIPVAALVSSLLAVAGCQPAHTAANVQPTDVDSIVLERSVCFGLCPAYRLTLQANGAVRFATTARSDTVLRADTISTRSIAWLAGEAHRAGFYALPHQIASDTALCAARATDHPTVTVTIQHGDSTYTVVDYTGCYMGHDLRVAPALRPLRQFENAIDSVANSKRWLDLARPR